MGKLILFLFGCLSNILFAEDSSDVGVVITNYSYDQFGRPIRSQSYPYDSNDPYNSYNYSYPTNLPGADPDRMNDIFEKNSKK